MDMLSASPILDGELLRAFAAFAEVLHFTAAARTIGLSQPALFDRVQRLSERLDATLYVREGRRLALTSEGERVAAFAREALARADTFMGTLRGDSVAPRVSLAAGEGAFLYLLGPALGAFARAADRELDVRVLGGPNSSRAVRTGEVDLAVGVYDIVPGALLARDVVSTPLCAALHRRHHLARGKTVRLADLASERPIAAPEGQLHRELVGRAFGSRGASADLSPLVADGWPLMLAFAAAGLGVAIVNGICRPPPGVVLRPIPELGEVTYRLLSRRDADPRPAVDDLAERILALRT